MKLKYGISREITTDHRNGHEVLLCESDDVYFVYNCKKGQPEDWFITRTSRDKIKSHQEEDRTGDVAAWRQVDREKSAQ